MSTSASTSRAQPHPATTATAEKSPFERQREALMSEIAVVQSLEHVLQNINKLNRSLEGVIAVGNEFGSVEALWSQFEGVMAKEEGGEEGREEEGDGGDEYGEEEGGGGEEEEEGEGDEGEGEEEQEDGKAEDRRR